MRILVVDDELSMREYLELLFTGAGYQVATADSAAAALVTLEREAFDLVISDMRLGRDSGLTVLNAARKRQEPPEVILITAFGTPATAVQAMREGAYDYICKPFDNEELKVLVQKALEKRSLRTENRQLRSSLAGELKGLFIGSSPGMQKVWHLVQKVAASRSTVLITGESGTGKEWVARAIHWSSPRAGQPFLPINCAALADGVLESELFGHLRGAFTGATHDRQGILASAKEGTVLLDEVGEVGLGVQVKLLRALQERKVKPVGSTAELPFEARLLAATNRKLDEDVKAGRFREDLFYRLNVITIDLPPLRERREDIRPLAELFLERISSELGRGRLQFSEEALGVLQEFSFPGNVRQLQNIIERAATLSDDALLGPDTLPAAVRGVPEPRGGAEPELGESFSLERHLDEAERRYLLTAMAKAGGVKTKAAQLLGLTFRSFRYRMAKHGLAAE